MTKRYARILSTGSYVPERVVTNTEVDALIGEPTSQWLIANVGIRERRWMAATRALDRVPETGRPFFQEAFALLNNATTVNFNNSRRAPLLLIAGSADNVIPAALTKTNYKRYRNSSVVTDFKEFPGRTHWIIAQDGWAEVAEPIATWLARQSRDSARGENQR